MDVGVLTEADFLHSLTELKGTVALKMLTEVFGTETKASQQGRWCRIPALLPVH